MKRLAVLLLVAACDDKPKPPPASTEAPAAVASVLGVDASLGEAVDPPAPVGDLKAEIEHFVNVDTCVAERAKLDPLVGDALKAIGYDTFLRDACRLLEAAKDKKKEACEKIDSGALRSKCSTWVAMLAQTPDSCPLIAEGQPGRGRVMECVAVAARDPRLCASESRIGSRAECEGLVTRNEARCDSLLPNDRASCRREVLRYKSLLGAPLDGLPKLPEVKSDLKVEGLETDAGPSATANAADVTRGAVVVTKGERVRIELGSLGDSDLLRLTGVPNRRVRVGMAIVIEPPALGSPKGKTSLERFELDIPGEAPLSCPSSKCTIEIKSADVGKTRGAEVSVVLSGAIPGPTKSYKVDFDAKTFVRDVVSESSSALGQPRPAVGQPR